MAIKSAFENSIKSFEDSVTGKPQDLSIKRDGISNKPIFADELKVRPQDFIQDKPIEMNKPFGHSVDVRALRDNREYMGGLDKKIPVVKSTFGNAIDMNFARSSFQNLLKEDEVTNLEKYFIKLANAVAQDLIDHGMSMDGVEVGELAKGLSVEYSEHGETGRASDETSVIGTDLRQAAKIAIAHIKNNPHYYEDLEACEKKTGREM